MKAAVVALPKQAKNQFAVIPVEEVKPKEQPKEMKEEKASDKGKSLGDYVELLKNTKTDTVGETPFSLLYRAKETKKRKKKPTRKMQQELQRERL